MPRVIRPTQFVSICSLPFLFLSGKTWHLEHITFRYLKRDIWYVNSHGRFFEFVVICQRQETGWSLQRVSLTLVFSPFAHFRVETLHFFSPLQLFPVLIIKFSSHRLVLNHEQMWKIHHHVFNYEHVWDWIVESRSQTSRRRPPLQPKLSETVWHSSRGFFLSWDWSVG